MINRESRPTDALVLIPAAVLADGALSFKARGILAYLLSLPVGSSISPNTLAKSGIDGDRAIKSGLAELEDAGYLIRTTSVDSEGQAVPQLSITDTPGIGVPTPAEPVHRDAVRSAERLLWLCEQHTWLSPAAVKTAFREIELIDIPLSVTKYEIRCVELKKSPNSGEWLRWTIEDEQKMRTAQQAEARAAGNHKKWFDVA